MSKYRFHLNNALAAWRRSLAYNRAFTADDLDELEQHLRDQVAGLVAAGLSEEAAFRQAMGEMGDYSAAEAEYRKVYWGKRRQCHQLLTELTWRGSMLKNYLKIAWRNVLREKGYAFINVFGLAIGIAFCLLIFLFVRDEFTYDGFHAEGDRLFRIEEAMLHPDGHLEGDQASLPIVVGPAMQAEVPGIERYIRFNSTWNFVRVQGAEAFEEKVLFADPAVLEAFTFPLQQGNPATALASPNNVVLTETMARKYFDEANPMGQTVQIRMNQTFEDFIVTGIAADVPGNSSIQFSILISFERLLLSDPSFRERAESWDFYRPLTYVQLAANASEQQVEAQLPDFYRMHHEDEEVKEGDAVQSYNLKPLREVHFTGGSKPDYSYVLSGMALAVLFIACINFMTLSIGRSARRAKEVGVRKVVGAGRRQIMAQFWGEAFLLSGIALVVGLLLGWAFLPVFNNLTDKALTMSMAANGIAVGVLVSLLVVTGLVAGSYPAVVLSRFHPIETLKNRLRLGGSSIFTKSLVVVQFGFTVFLITITIVMARQLNYTRSMDLGFDKEQVVVIPTKGLDAEAIANRFRTELENQPGVVDVTASGNMLGRKGTMGIAFRREEKRHLISVFRVDEQYLDFLDLKLVAGRNFDPAIDTDLVHPVIVNEALVRDLGIEDPIGQPIPFPWATAENAQIIIGVVRDYHAQSLYSELGSVMLTRDPGWAYENILVRIRPEGITQTLDVLKTTWEATASDVPFVYIFLDDQMQLQYAEDQRWGQIIRYATGFAFLIACMGLLGLAALTVTRRTKEIGVRKVLGATVPHIVVLISKEFSVLVGIGILLASPVAFIVMQRWLQNFAYHIPLSWWIFGVAGVVALGATLITVGYHAIKSALKNPVNSLRYE